AARQPRQAPVLRGPRDQRIDALALLAHPVHQRARELPDLRIGRRVEVLPEEREAPRVLLAVAQEVDLIERLQGQLARGSTRPHVRTFAPPAAPAPSPVRSPRPRSPCSRRRRRRAPGPAPWCRR